MNETHTFPYNSDAHASIMNKILYNQTLYDDLRYNYNYETQFILEEQDTLDGIARYP